MNAPAGRLLATAWSLHLPNVPVGRTVTEHVGTPRGGWAWERPVPAERAATVLGRKGLLSREPATRLALCAVHRALGLPPGRRPAGPSAPDTAVVVASNLGNVEAVARTARTVAVESARGISPLDAPNVSGNVIASTIGLWFGFGGPNLLVCSGGGAGLDALAVAGLLLAARRARRVILVGVEPADEVASALHAVEGGRPPLRAGAACVVLEPWRPGAGRAEVEVMPAGAGWPRPDRLLVGPGGFDPVAHWGDHYGAQDVIALALAAHLAVDERHRTVGVRGHDAAGGRAVLVRSTERGGAEP